MNNQLTLKDFADFCNPCINCNKPASIYLTVDEATDFIGKIVDKSLRFTININKTADVILDLNLTTNSFFITNQHLLSSFPYDVLKQSLFEWRCFNCLSFINTDYIEFDFNHLLIKNIKLYAANLLLNNKLQLNNYYYNNTSSFGEIGKYGKDLIQTKQTIDIKNLTKQQLINKINKYTLFS